jgi:hypothetical protein
VERTKEMDIYDVEIIKKKTAGNSIAFGEVFRMAMEEINREGKR